LVDLMEDARIGLVVDGRYRIEKRLAAGGMGVVYRAERVGLSKPVAIKFLHRSQAGVANRRQRFEREAAAMSRLSHPNLVSIIDYGELEDAPYLVMEYHRGVPLRRVLDHGKLEPARAVDIARQLLAGLDSAHASGVVHRDLKPDNVLIIGKPGEDHVKVLDFGVAKLMEGDGAPSELSVMAGSLLGTAEYMAPEQVRCEVVDPRADLYAVGILLYEMLTGKRPFEAERDLAVLRMQLEDAPVSPRQLVPELSPRLEKVVLRALEKDRELRFGSAEEMSRALGATREARVRVQLNTERSTGVYAPAPPRRRRWSLWVLAFFALLALNAAGLWVAHDQGAIELPLPDAWLRAIGLDPAQP
jgi:eukaryotic-like serine/threonine-protein kinase